MRWKAGPSTCDREDADGAPDTNATNYAAAELSINAAPSFVRNVPRVTTPLNIFSRRAKLSVPTALWSGHFCPRSNGHGRRHSAGIPSRRKREGAGVLGSPTGRPFFIVDGD